MEHAVSRDMTGTCCIVCGRFGVNRHHEPPKGLGGERAWKGSLVSLCGSGTTGCHGLRHAGRLKLRFNETDDRWEWIGTNSRGLTTRQWTPCHGDDFWNAMAGM
ncbi:MAG: hypothetical protein J6S36_03250 [Eggerthellaceae bacterium]|nr:hypothetical protein [Eggerthellaceae bacterium]